MNIEDIREYCLQKPYTDEAFPFDETILVFRLMGKIFACLNLERPNLVVLKCEPDYALVLRDQYQGIEGAWAYLVNANLSDTPKSLVEVGYDEADTTGMLVWWSK